MIAPLPWSLVICSIARLRSSWRRFSGLRLLLCLLAIAAVLPRTLPVPSWHVGGTWGRIERRFYSVKCLCCSAASTLRRVALARKEAPVETVRLVVRLVPRASRNEVAGFEGETLRVRVTAPPVEGRANRALERLLAKRLDLPRGAVRVVAGQASRNKVVAVDGLDAAELHRRLGVSDIARWATAHGSTYS
ncbi:MAG: DUF167 domain-containing protein [Chloroflexi bacterium]|nr:DUF167 domain-containing protein [Chloroflexota bacterium]